VLGVGWMVRFGGAAVFACCWFLDPWGLHAVAMPTTLRITVAAAGAFRDQGTGATVTLSDQIIVRQHDLEAQSHSAGFEVCVSRSGP